VVQRIERVGVEARELGRERHVDLAARGHDGEARLVPDLGQRDPESGRVADDLGDREEPRHVRARLGGQVVLDAPEVARLAGRLGALERPRDVAFARVVARDGEEPVAVEHAVQVLEVVERGARRLEHVAPAVEPPVLCEAEPAARAGNDLPEPGRAAVRIREWVERALDDGQQRELGRHAARLERAHDVEQVQIGAREDAVEIGLIARIPVPLALDGRIVGDLPREARPEPREQVLLEDRVAERELRQHDGLERRGDGRNGRRRLSRLGTERLTSRRGSASREDCCQTAAPAQPVVLLVHRAPEPILRVMPYRTSDRRWCKV
jgi:hypothetical protein